MTRALILAVGIGFAVTAAGTTAPRPSLGARGAKAMSSFLDEAVTRGDVPGVVVLVTGPDRVLYHEAFGSRDVAQHLPMQKDTIFRIASMTKALTSAAAMMLVEQGKLGLDDEVATYLPAFKNPQVIRRVDLVAGTWETRPATRPLTIRQLLTHTSGIGYVWSDPGLALIGKVTGSTSEVDLPLVHEPGAQWTYGASTKVLGDVIERISGESLEAFMQQHLFGPLGMQDTGWSVPAAEAARVATLHQRLHGRLVETPNPAVLSAAVRGDGRLFSTAADYARFIRLMLNEGRTGHAQLLKPETVREMRRNQTGDLKVRLQPTADAGYSRPFPAGVGEDVWGFGFQIAMPATPRPDMRRPGSMTWAGIDNTFFWIDPQSKVGVLVMMQLLPFYDESALRVLDGVESRVYQNLRTP